MKLFYMTVDVYRANRDASSDLLGKGWELAFPSLACAENNGTGVGVARKDVTPDVERQTLHYFKGSVDLRLGDMLVAEGKLYRLGSPYNCRGHHMEVTSERIGEMKTATVYRRKRDELDTPTEEIEGTWEVRGLMASKRHREETVGGTGRAVRPIKTFTALNLPEGLEEPLDDDIFEIDGKKYTAIQENEAVMNADPGLWTVALAEGAI